jgi:hypothetical protein
MKALSVIFNFPYPKIWINVLRYENTTFTRQNPTVLWSSVAVSEESSGYRNRRYFWTNFELQFMI